MNIEQAIEQWLNLCPCKNLDISDLNYPDPKNKFNHTKTIILFYKNDQI